MNTLCIMKYQKQDTYKIIKEMFPLPDDICVIISRFVGKDVKCSTKPTKRWVRLKYPNEKRLVRVEY